MKLITKLIAFNIALMASFSTSAADNGGDPKVNQRLLHLLERLESDPYDSPVVSAVATVGGIFRFTITVYRVSANLEPMACGARLTHFIPSGGYYSESAAGRVVWNGNTGTCNVTIPYIWKKADSAYKVGVTTFLDPYYPCGATCVERPIQRSSSHDHGDIPLPANGTVTTITDVFRL